MTNTKITVLALLLAGSLPARAFGQAPPARPSDSAPTAATAAPTPAPEATPAAEAPAPAPAAPAAALAAPAPPAPAAAPAPGAAPAGEPLAGFSDGTAFLRSPDGLFTLFPNGRLQTDGYFFSTDAKSKPNNTFLLRRARAEVAGWIGTQVFFSIAGDFASGAPAGADPVAQKYLATTDDYVGIAPWGDIAMLQFGQFDAPFTFENRTSDKYFDFMERSITVRSFGIPSNKELGLMVHGTPVSRLFYYSAGVFNGDGQNYVNADTNFDVMGRAWVAPLALASMDELKAITVGGSFWTGKRTGGLPLASLTTQAGFTIAKPSWSFTDMSVTPNTTTSYELHQEGTLTAWALELNAPIAHKFGARVEYVHKNQDLGEDVTGSLNKKGAASLDGWGAYGELWWWAVGDDRILPEPGLQIPPRFKKFGVKAPQHGLMLAVRAEYVTETVTDGAGPTVVGTDALLGTTKVTSVAGGVNYWLSKRFRATANYVYNKFDGDSAAIVKGIVSSGTPAAQVTSEQEFLFRLAIAL